VNSLDTGGRRKEDKGRRRKKEEGGRYVTSMIVETQANTQCTGYIATW
jgi:hypothetical protein